MTKRICTKNPLSHSEAAKVIKQLKRSPEVCDHCDIEPCVMAIYVFGKAGEK